jgi:hypothetical protein
MNGSVQSTAENPERDVQSGEGIFPILDGGPPEFAWPYSAANRGRTTNAIQLPSDRIDVTRNRQIDHKERRWQQYICSRHEEGYAGEVRIVN